MGEWKVAKLSSLAAINYGYTESASAAPIGPRFLRITDIQDEAVDWLSVPFCPIDAADLSKFRLVHNDIVFARTGATTGKSFLVQDPPEAVFASYLIRLRLRTDELLPSFVNLFFQTAAYWRSIAAGSTGSAQGGFNASKLGDLAIRFPSVASQFRIVAILDEAFAGISTAKANAEKNLQNARELFTSHLERVFGQRGTDWHEAPLLSFASAISTGPFGSLLHKSDYVSDGVPLVNPINIVDGLIVPDPDKLIDSTSKQRLQSYVLREGDIVVGRRGEIGRCAVVGPSEDGWVCGTGCFFIRPLPTVRSAFIAHLIRSREYRARLERVSTGATMKNLSNTALGELHVAVPPIAEQDRALALIGRLAVDCGRLAEVYERKLVALDELKKSLLHQAFTGALTGKSADKQVAEVA